MKNLIKFLQIWTVINIGFGISAMPQLFTYLTSNIAIFMVSLLGVLTALSLSWFLFSPSRTVILFGCLFWGLQSVGFVYDGFAVAYQLGLSVKLGFTIGSGFVVFINIIALLTCAVFCFCLQAYKTTKDCS